jgi:hypothetical protein
MAKSKKNKNKPKLNLTVREEQRNKLEQMASLEKRSQQTARNCAEQFSILSPGEKCQSKNGLVEILSFSFWQALCSAIHLATTRARFV